MTHHARDAIVNAPNRFIAELRCVIYAMSSLRDLGATNIIISTDYNEIIEAIKSPRQLPRYRALLQQILHLKSNFVSVTF